MLTITIDRGLEGPVYEQVAHQIRLLIASGALLILSLFSDSLRFVVESGPDR